MSYKNTCEKTLNNLKVVVSALADARDSLENEELEPVIQGLVESLACLKNLHERMYNQALLEELKSNQK